jgi:hypothetical protein
MGKKSDDEMMPTGKDAVGRFVAGNKFSEGLVNSGRPPMYETAEQLMRRAEEYIETTKQKNGVYKPTITGLTFHLGFESLQSFYDYEKRAEFSYTINRLRLFVKSCYEQQLYTFAWAGAFAALKNIGRGEWTDEVIQQQNQTVTTVNPQVVNGDAPPLAHNEGDVKE